MLEAIDVGVVIVVESVVGFIAGVRISLVVIAPTETVVSATDVPDSVVTLVVGL